jgi:MATE family multidrug resistance protein
LNILFNYLLIFGNWGFPALGVIGAGYGTLISRVLMVLFIAVVLYRSSYFREFITRLNWKKTSWGYVKKILNLGLPTSAQVFFEVTLFTMAIWLSGILGTIEQAANQIALNLSSMTYMVGQGLSVAAMIRVGNQKGKKDIVRLKEVAFSLFGMTLLIEIVFALAFLIFRHDLPLVYLDTESSLNQVENLKVISLASMLLLWSAFFQISDGLQVVILGALRGIQDVNVPALITFIAYWVIAFPVCYILAIELEWGGNGIWIGLLVGLTASALLLYLRFVFLLRKQQF